MSGAPAATVAVIDIGSNSIKSLVARRAPDGGLAVVRTQSLDARISAGISGATPRLAEPSMMRGIEAVQTLLAGVTEYSPREITLVATSAVRDAANGADFCARVQTATGHAVRILSGEEEANGIGRGLTADPALHDLRDFYVFDIGGGSLECLAFHNRRVGQAVSLRLGCVRLTERLVADPAQALAADTPALVAAQVRTEFARAGFSFSLASGAAAVGSGGTVATVRAILGARRGVEFGATSPVVTVAEVRELYASLGVLPLAERRQVPGLPPARADVFPVALATLLAVAELGGFTTLRNSVYNLRYGLADALLPAP
jgi:exopolyphosphatase/guanosine-5'-triphosphate,3'-diphosphate pyrophosphatase